MIEYYVVFSGWLMIALALLHIGFPRYFLWREQLSSLSLINRQMMQVHTFFIALAVALMGLLCITGARELCVTPLGQKVASGLAFFWFVRLVAQLAFYSSALWKGKRFETTIHILFTILWLGFTIVFTLAAAVHR